MKLTPILLAATTVALSANAMAQLSPPPGRTAAPTTPAGADPFVADPNASAATADAGGEFDPFNASQPPLFSIRYEVFSLDIAAAGALLRQRIPDAKLYDTLIASIDEEQAAQEALVALTLRSGERASSESISEKIYPTEYDPPNTPTAYETRNRGITIEAEVISDPQSGRIELSVAPEHVNLVGLSEWGPPDSPQEMPEFDCQRLNTTTQVTPDVPRLLGTINPPPSSKLDDHVTRRIWFAFATVSHVK